jgi:hypothetical protein
MWKEIVGRVALSSDMAGCCSRTVSSGGVPTDVNAANRTRRPRGRRRFLPDDARERQSLDARSQTSKPSFADGRPPGGRPVTLNWPRDLHRLVGLRQRSFPPIA